MHVKDDEVPAADRRVLLANIMKLADGILPEAKCRHTQEPLCKEIIREWSFGSTKHTLLWSVGLEPRPDGGLRQARLRVCT